MLQTSGLNAYYGKSHVLQGVDITVGKREIVALLGRNGSGRSTTAKAIMGSVNTSGSIQFNGEEICGFPPYVIARRGIGYVPETRDIFPGLTVNQNLMLGMKSTRATGQWTLEAMYSLFPSLDARRHVAAGVLSGGEQQMLTICRTLMGDPRLIIIDEPTEGLAPKIVEQISALIRQISERGVAVLLIEQKLTIALEISQRAYVMGHGTIVFSGTPDDLRASPNVRQEWLEV